MTPIFITQFVGAAPRVNPALLQDNAAQVASNCRLLNSDLRSLKAPLQVVTPTALGAAIRSIYRIGQGLPETQYWMAWTGDVNVIRGFVAGDTSERTFYTGDGAPKVTNLQMATQGGLTYPVNSYLLGMPVPATAPICAASSAVAPVETRVYVYTYVSSLGEEGKPSPPTKVVVSQSGSVALSGLASAPAGNYNIASKRIYRAQQTANGSAVYLFVAEIPIATATYNDTILSTDLKEPLPSLDYDMPPATMKGIIAGTNGVAAAFNGYDVLFCEPYLPYAWPIKYRLTADYPIVGLGHFGTSFVVLTTGTPYLITGVHPSQMSMEAIELAQACVAKKSIVSIGGAVVYASPDGLVSIGAGGSRVITEQHFTRDEWQALNPASIEAYCIDNQYVATFSGGGGFILDLGLDKANYTTFDDTVTAGYVDPINDALYLCIAGNIQKFHAGAAKTYTWRSKKFQLYGAYMYPLARIDADAYPVTFKAYADGVLVHTQVVANAESFRLDEYGDRVRELEIELSGTNPIRFVGLADNVKDLKRV